MFLAAAADSYECPLLWLRRVYRHCEEMSGSAEMQQVQISDYAIMQLSVKKAERDHELAYHELELILRDSIFGSYARSGIKLRGGNKRGSEIGAGRWFC